MYTISNKIVILLSLFKIIITYSMMFITSIDCHLFFHAVNNQDLGFKKMIGIQLSHSTYNALKYK